MKALTPAERRERRMSKDDAWVDILEVAHNRRMGSQEVERRPGSKVLKGGRSNPELASQEIVAVLANVRARSPISDEEDIQVHQLVEPATLTPLEKSKPKAENPDIESVMLYPKSKCVGYFDLHPEWRPAGAQPLSVWPQTHANDYDGDDIPDQRVYGPPEIPFIWRRSQ